MAKTRVAYLRRKMGLMQREIVVIVGVNPAAYSMIENGWSPPPPTAERIEAFFKHPIKELLRTVDSNGNPVDTSTERENCPPPLEEICKYKLLLKDLDSNIPILEESIPIQAMENLRLARRRIRSKIRVLFKKFLNS